MQPATFTLIGPVGAYKQADAIAQLLIDNLHESARPEPPELDGVSFKHPDGKGGSGPGQVIIAPDDSGADCG